MKKLFQFLVKRIPFLSKVTFPSSFSSFAADRTCRLCRADHALKAHGRIR
jgi:hypothetical protein